ncbi:RNA polymerase sigma factor [Megalodesulfovibrio paquesii]
MDQEREHAIIRQVLAGDREAFALLVEAHQGQLFHLSYLLTGSADHAEDLVQETFIRMYDKLGSFRLEPGTRLTPWMYAICRNTAARQRRRSGRLLTGLGERPQGESPSEGEGLTSEQAEGTCGADGTADVETAVLRSEQGRVLASHLLRLPVDLREALALRFTEDLSFREVADVLGISEQAAKMRVYRGLARLRDTLPSHVWR